MTISLKSFDSPDDVRWLHPGADNLHYIEQISTTVQELSQRFPSSFREYLKAIYLDQMVIGFTAFYPTEVLSDQVWLIHTFMIDQQVQGRGYGKLAFEMLMKHILSVNVQHVPIELSSNNPVALKMYKHFGFREVSPDRSLRYRQEVIDETLLRYEH